MTGPTTTTPTWLNAALRACDEMLRPKSRSRSEIEELVAPLMPLPLDSRAGGFSRGLGLSSADMDARAWLSFGIAIDEYTDAEIREAIGWLVRSAAVTSYRPTPPELADACRTVRRRVAAQPIVPGILRQ